LARKTQQSGQQRPWQLVISGRDLYQFGIACRSGGPRPLRQLYGLSKHLPHFSLYAQRNRAFLPRAEFVLPDLHSLLTLTKSDFEVVFAGSAIKRIGRNRMVRNACIAAGNSGNHTLLPNLTLLLTDESAMVRGAAIWALWQIDPQHTLALKEKWGEQEQDGSVLAEWQQTCPSAAELAA
jgi:hypothetical protein